MFKLVSLSVITRDLKNFNKNTVQLTAAMPRGAKQPARYISRTGAIRKFKTAQPKILDLHPDGPSTSRQNRYAALADHTDMDTAYESNIAPQERQPKPPPIVADMSVPLKEIQHLLGKDCVYKRTSIGTKIFPSDKEKHEFCLKALKENKIEFHTFNGKENRLFTTFLYGLPRIDSNDIITELKCCNLIPSSVTEVNTKFSSANDAVYRVQFVRKTFNPKSLQNIKTICNVIIKWKKQKPKRNDNPTQCWNCLMYGHGGDHCSRKPACMICANDHLTSECHFNNSDKRPAAYSCFNCKKHGRERTDHSANDIHCPLRALYLEAREEASTRRQKKVPLRRRNSFVIQENEFPSLCREPANSVRFEGNRQRTYADSIKCNKNTLFSIDELFNIFTSSLEELEKCTTRAQQMQVVMSLVKYAYDIK